MNNFKILDKLGEGAYSIVYRVLRYSDNEQYALKKVKMKSLSEKEKRNALNEVRLLASVKSNYIISYKEAFIDEADSTLCIVMEYADDGDLLQKIAFHKGQKTYFKESEIWRIFLNVVQGLHDLHEFNILHRDLKSANVFLFKDGSAKLGDLNVSKVAPRGLSCTQTGTPIYASPEVWKDNPYDLKSDIWSLGCVSYEMIMLKTPFTAKNMEELYKKIMKGKYQEISPRYSDDLKTVISLLLEVNPQFRPDTNKILSLPEVKDKIERYKIFKNYNYQKMREEPNTNSNNNILNSNSPYRKESALNPMSASNNINNNNIATFDKNKFNKHNEPLRRKSKFGSLDVITETEENNKIVMDTIQMPKKLFMLNKKLPEANYIKDKERIKEIQKIQNIQHMSFPNVILPNINVKQSYDNNNNNNDGNGNNLDYAQGYDLSPNRYKEAYMKNVAPDPITNLQKKIEKINTIKYKIQKQNQMISSKKMNLYVE